MAWEELIPGCNSGIEQFWDATHLVCFIGHLGCTAAELFSWLDCSWLPVVTWDASSSGPGPPLTGWMRYSVSIYPAVPLSDLTAVELFQCLLLCSLVAS